VIGKNIKNHPKNQVNIPSFKIEQSQKADFTANGGMFLIAELFKKINIVEKLAKLNIFHRKMIGEAVHILTLVINQHTGGDAIFDTQYVEKDGALRAIFGDMHIPAPHTSGDFLERFTEESIERLRTIIHKMQEKHLKKLSKRFNSKIIISIDSSVYEVYGNCKENSSYSYKNIFGYHPLLLHIHNTGELLDIVFRGGSDFTSTGAEDMLTYNIQRLKPYFDEIVLLADAGFFEKGVIDVCEEFSIKFIITSETNAPIRRKLTNPELRWEELQDDNKQKDSDVKHRDSHTFNYKLESLKASLKKRNKQLKIRGQREVAEFEHTVPSWGLEYRFIYKRQPIIIQDLFSQSDLFESKQEYFYHGYITNIDDKSIEEIIHLIDSRGHQENFIKDFKRGLGTVHIPTKHFFGNYAYFLISMLSWNLKYWLLYIINPELNIQWKRFRYIFIKVGVQIVKSGKYLIIRFGKNFGRVEEFINWHNRLCQAIIE
jgi:hypothetical protein